MQNLFKTVLLIVLAGWLGACAGWNPNNPAEADRRARAAVAEFRKHDPGLKNFFNKAYAYAIYPTVGKGAIGIGGAHGNGAVYHRGRLIGLSSLTQVSIGFQLGGEAYSELIFFENADAFRTFKSGKLKFSAQASAVAATVGAAAKTSYSNHVAVFTLIQGGLMYEASIGGQSFTFEPVK